jgi:serine/threonine-protein kinase
MGYHELVNEAAAVPSKVCTACGTRYPADALFCPSDGTPLQSGTSADRDVADPYLGQEISGHIEIRQLVGIGAMGRVYRAFQRGIDRDVAVKILHRELSANAQLVSRFTREAKVASRLQHPNVVQVLLAGQLPDRALYMVMEYLDGLSLQSALAAAGGALPLPRALHIVLQLCEAAGEAHAQGIVHRDLKPENVMLVKRGPDADFVKVLDFGIARINWGEQSVATAAGLIFGTARYISPEGAQGNAVGPASDVYSIATLLFQMLSGRTPFEGDQAVGLLVQQIHDPAPALKSLSRAQYVPDPIADVVMANLAKDPKRREPDGRALGQAIFDAAKAAGLSPDDFSRPLIRRQPSAIQLPPMERTKQHELTPELIERMTPAAPQANGNGHNGHASPRGPMGATAKWEPPADFQARLAEASEPVFPAVGPVPAPAKSRPRTVDETMDDASVEPAVAAAIATPPPIPTAVPRTIPGDAESAPRTHYTPPIPEVTREASAPSHPSLPPTPVPAEPRRSRGVLLVVLCFVLGALLAAGWAWKMGRLGGDGADQDRYVARATDAMFKNRFHEPPGDNVKDITDEGLKRWPNERRLVDIRIRASNELTNQALAQRAAGDVAEALRLAKLAHELDPNDASSKRLAEQYEAELAAFTAPAAPPLNTKPAGTTPPATNVKASSATPPPPPSGASATAYKAVLDVSNATPRLGQNVELTARVLPPHPPKGGFDAAGFTIVGPGVPGGVRVPAQSPEPGVFKASYAFLESGKFDVTFSVQADTKALSAKRTVAAGESAPPGPPPTPTQPPPTPTTTGSVKWM